jgi:phage tail sheath protein FI
MPEYLAPGVYVEEISSGNKPIQAASTSTAGMVGMAVRGPVNRPTLVTSRGAYARVFGGLLDPSVFREGRDALPYAADGFFTNGGARLYVVRVVGRGASESTLTLVAGDPEHQDAAALTSGARAGQTGLLTAAQAGYAAGTTVLIGHEVATVADPAVQRQPRLGNGLRSAYHPEDTVHVQTAGSPVTVTGALQAGAAEIVLDGELAVDAGTVVLLRDASGAAGDQELVQVESAVSEGDTTRLTLAEPLQRSHPEGSSVSVLTEAGGGEPTARLRAAVGPSRSPVLLPLDDATGVSEGAVVRLTTATAGGGAGHQELAVVTDVPEVLALTSPLAGDHASGTSVVAVVATMTVHARWPGLWGRSLCVTVRPSALVKTATTAELSAAGTEVAVRSAVGLHPGSVITLTFAGPTPPAPSDDDPGTPTESPAPAPQTHTAEIAQVDTAAGTVTLTEAPGVAIPAGTPLVSQEFALEVERWEHGKVVERESFDTLSPVSRHPRFAPTIVGSWDTGTDRPSDSGESLLIRLSPPVTAGTQLLPLVPCMPRFLSGGGDDEAGVDESAYVGVAAEDPQDRTGIQALENETALSILGVPGQTSVTVQQALIAHCDKMRYRFAVLDVPAGSKLEQARSHRQNFDTTRAALYYPDLLIADPFGSPGDRRTISPSGHVMGVYARTDTARGVHKAPANEVLSGVLGLRTPLSKGEQDVLNPVHLNCLRDFRTENRGLRVYGARVATSDPEWKYVNVRRLLLFIEQSLDAGLQWAVFEPNDKPLWDSVKQSITGFLTTVWRSGALEGTKQEEAFFVNIGYDVTMTQADIDNGLLVVEVGVAAVKPAEFVVVRISQKTREATA